MPSSPHLRGLLARSWMVALAALMHTPQEAAAWSFSLQSASRRVFMYVGTASYAYNAQGNAIGVNNNTTVDTMSSGEMSIGLMAILNGTARWLLTTEPRNRTYVSQWNRSTACPTDDSVIVGAGYQNSSTSPATASVTLSSPAQLTSLEGYGLPFSNISWASYSPDTLQKDSRWIEKGTLGTIQTLASVPRNTVTEVCFEFTYGSTTPYPAATYQGTITFTASTP